MVSVARESTCRNKSEQHKLNEHKILSSNFPADRSSSSSLRAPDEGLITQENARYRLYLDTDTGYKLTSHINPNAKGKDRPSFLGGCKLGTRCAAAQPVN